MSSYYPNSYYQRVDELFNITIQQQPDGDSKERLINGLLYMLSDFLLLSKARVVTQDSATDKLKIKYSYGLSSSDLTSVQYRKGEGVTGTVYETGDAIVVENIDDDPLFLGKIKRNSSDEYTKAFIAVPILDSDRTVFGVLAANAHDHSKGDALMSKRLLEKVANNIGELILS